MYENLKQSESLWDDLDILKGLSEGDLVVSMSSGRVAPITKSTKGYVTAFGIRFRRETGDEAGRRGNGGRRMLPLTTRTLEEVVYKLRPEERPQERPTPQHNPDVLKSKLAKCQTPAQRLSLVMSECAAHGNKFVLRVQHIYGNATMHVVGYHIPGEPWVELAHHECIEFPDSAFYMACDATGCTMSRPVKQSGLNYHWMMTAGAQPDGLNYGTRTMSAETIERKAQQTYFEDTLYFQSLA